MPSPEINTPVGGFDSRTTLAVSSEFALFPRAQQAHGQSLFIHQRHAMEVISHEIELHTAGRSCLRAFSVYPDSPRKSTGTSGSPNKATRFIFLVFKMQNRSRSPASNLSFCQNGMPLPANGL